MRKFSILITILDEVFDVFTYTSDFIQTPESLGKCDGFLCSGDGICKCVEWKSQFLTDQQYYDMIYAVTHVFLGVGNEEDLSKLFLPIIRRNSNWAQCFDRREVSIRCGK